MYKYRVSFHDRLNLQEGVKAECEALEFIAKIDILTPEIGEFKADLVPENVSVGDLIVIWDSSRKVLSKGVITSIKETIVQFNQINSIFNFEWNYSFTNQSTIELTIKSIIESFKTTGDPLIDDFFSAFDVVVTSTTTGSLGSEPIGQVTNFESWIYLIYTGRGVIVDVNLNYNQGQPTISVGQVVAPEELLIDNNSQVLRVEAKTEVFATNVLIVYDSLGALRGKFYTSALGITTNVNEPTRPRVPIIRYQYSDDDINLIKAQNIRNDIFDHEVIVWFSLKQSRLYNFYSWVLGQRFKIADNGKIFESVLTGYQLEKAQGEDLTYVILTFGMVRRSITYAGK